jgi:hypothetical protein
MELHALSTREEDGWSVLVGGEKTLAGNRSDAIDQMLNRATEILPKDGYSMFTPTGLRELP